MRWIDAIVQEVKPAFGGIPTFCEDPDHLLERPELREALRAVGMEVSQWDGELTSLAPLTCLACSERPLVVVGDTAKRHLVRECVPDHVWVAIGLSHLFSRFPREIVQSVPPDKWDEMLALHETVRSSRSPQDTTILIARALYGLDAAFLGRRHTWLHVLAQTALDGDGVPAPICSAVCAGLAAPAWLAPASAPEALADPVVAREVVLQGVATDPGLLESMPHSTQVLIAHMRRETGRRQTRKAAAGLVDDWARSADSAASVLRFATRYGEARAAEAVSPEQWLEIDCQFTTWLQESYGLMQSSPNPEVLRSTTLLQHLDERADADRMMVVVIDSLSLQAWPRVAARWRANGAIGRAETRAAFAVLPTITSLGRRAFFEGKPPAQFSSADHSQRLERQLWAARFPGEGHYCTVEEQTGILDVVAKGKRRICVLDVTWDKLGHGINPQVLSVPVAADNWARRTPVAGVVRGALDAGYRVFVTSDHGQVECCGIGRPNVGVLPNEKGKRVLVFGTKAVCESYASDAARSFRPSGLAPDMHPLFALRSASFDLANAEAVSHGGLSLDEAIVPVAEVMK